MTTIEKLIIEKIFGYAFAIEIQYERARHVFRSNNKRLSSCTLLNYESNTRLRKTLPILSVRTCCVCSTEYEEWVACPKVLAGIHK